MTPASSNDFIRRKHDVSDIPVRWASSDADTRPSDCSMRKMRQSASIIRMADFSSFCLPSLGFHQNSGCRARKEAETTPEIGLEPPDRPKDTATSEVGVVPLAVEPPTFGIENFLGSAP